MRTVEKLLNASRDMKSGNHRVEHITNNFGHEVRKFYYYATVIAYVNDTKRTFTIDASYGSSSTTRACNAYRRELCYTHTEVEL